MYSETLSQPINQEDLRPTKLEHDVFFQFDLLTRDQHRVGRTESFHSGACAQESRRSDGNSICHATASRVNSKSGEKTRDSQNRAGCPRTCLLLLSCCLRTATIKRQNPRLHQAATTWLSTLTIVPVCPARTCSNFVEHDVQAEDAQFRVYCSRCGPRTCGDDAGLHEQVLPNRAHAATEL